MKNHAIKCKTHDINFAAGNVIPRECDCDGYHTFDELYDHRITLFIALCHELNNNSGYGYVWRSLRHSNGELAYGGNWFVLGISKNAGKQITYHLPLDSWADTDGFETLEKAPEWDGHTSDDVLDRIKKL